VDGRGVPLSIIVTGANRHDVTQLEAVLSAIMVKRPAPTERRNKHLCADAAYTGAAALGIIQEHGCIPHVKGRKQEVTEKKHDPRKKARRWIVEVAHSWFNRFRKLLVRYEKLECSFLGLNHLAAAIIAFRKVSLTVNIIYGYVLSRELLKDLLANSPEVARLIEQDLPDAKALNVTMTPEYFVNGKGLPSFGYEQLKDLVADALANAKGT
jgi:transposase